MPTKAKLRAAALGGSPDDVEAAFYDALQKGDLQRLMACWADEDDIVCVHPGGSRLLGAGAIRAGFEALFAGGRGVPTAPQGLHKVQSLASAMHSVLECVPVLTSEGARNAWVIATNVYHQTPQGWRLVAHHASPGTLQDASGAMEPPQVLH